MEALAVLRLSALPRRHNCGHGYLEDDEVELETPYTSAPSSPRRAFAKAGVEEEPLGEVRAAVPFVWELVPGKPKNELEESGPSGSSDEAEDCGRQDRSESCLSRDSSHTEFEFSSRLVEPAEPPSRAAEALFSHGHLLPLRLPPRLQAVKHLRTSNVSSCSDSSLSSSSSFQTYHSPQSPASPKKSLPLSPFTKEPRSLSPPRNLSSNSASSSSSSKSGENEEHVHGSALTDDHLFTDMATASTRSSEDSKSVEQSRRALLKQQQERWIGFADAEQVDAATSPALAGTRGLSRSNARSRPSIDVQGSPRTRRMWAGPSLPAGLECYAAAWEWRYRKVLERLCSTCRGDDIFGSHIGQQPRNVERMVVLNNLYGGG